jgi:threonine dehydratase
VHRTVPVDDIAAASGRLAGQVRRTPVLAVDDGELGPAGPRWLKLEVVQHSGTFKARGALNALLTQAVPDAGVLVASGGNHGAAVAWAARRLGHRATIYVPEVVAPAKVARLRAYGAEVRLVPGVYADALDAADEHARQRPVLAVHAYDDPAVVAGAATLAVELDEQVPALDTVVVACGGGGLSAGLASWFGARVRLVVVETAGTATFAGALAAGGPVDVAVSGVAADALGATRLGSIAWSALSSVDARSVVVTDEDVVAAQHLLWDRFRVVAEPAASAAVAALTTGAYRPDPDERVAVVLCGANTDPSSLAAPRP